MLAQRCVAVIAFSFELVEAQILLYPFEFVLLFTT